MWQNKTQSSLEYLLVVALTFVIMVPTAYLLYSYSKESAQEIKDSQITQIGKTIVDSAEAIFYSGEGSKTEIELNIPDNVNKVEIIDGRELVFNVRADFGSSDIIFFSPPSVKITPAASCSSTTGEIAELKIPGLKKLSITSIRDGSANCISIRTI